MGGESTNAQKKDVRLPDGFKIRPLEISGSYHKKATSMAVMDPLGHPVGTIEIIAGYGDPVEVYADHAQYWVDRGYRVGVLEFPPDGKIDDYLAMHRTFHQHMTKGHPAGHPRFSISHSTGSLAVLLNIGEGQVTYDANVAGGPLIGTSLRTNLGTAALRTFVKMGTIFGKASRPLPNVNTLLRLLNGEDDPQTADGEAAARYRDLFNMASGYQPQTNPTFRFLDSALDRLSRINRSFYRDFPTGSPFLFVVGARDPYIGERHILRAQERLPGSEVLRLPETGHNIWHTTPEDMERCFSAMHRFFEKACIVKGLPIPAANDNAPLAPVFGDKVMTLV